MALHLPVSGDLRSPRVVVARRTPLTRRAARGSTTTRDAFGANVLRVLHMKKVEIDTLAHRELRNRSAEVLRRVEEGATFQITNHGRVVAVIGPADARPDLRVRRAHARGGFASLPRVRIEGAAQEHLDELRGER